MRILTRYYISRFVGLFAMTLVAAILILATIELVLNLDDLSTFGSGQSTFGSGQSSFGSGQSSFGSGQSSFGSGQSAVAAEQSALGSDPTSSGVAQTEENGSVLIGAFRYLAIRITAGYLTELLPIVSFLAMFLTFAWAGRALELVVLQAGGIRLPRVLAPVLGVALILSLAAALAHETIVLRARQAWIQETQQSQDPMNLDQRGDRRAFWHRKGRTIANIAYAEPESRTLHGVEIFERGPAGRIVRVIRAERVRIAEDGAWILADAAIWRFDPEQDSAQPQYAFRSEMTLDLNTLDGDALLGAEPGSLSLSALSAYLASHSDQKTSRLRQVAVRYHERLSSPWLVLAFAFLALPFALAVDRSGRFAGPAAAALATLGAFFLVRSAGITLAQEGLIPPAFAAWLPLGLIVAGTLLALRRSLAR